MVGREVLLEGLGIGEIQSGYPEEDSSDEVLRSY